MRATLVLALCLTAVAAVPHDPQRIIGGTVTTIGQYPWMASLLHTWNHSTWSQACAGTIINLNTIMTAAHCTIGDSPATWRARVGSTMANSGGQVVQTRSILNHPDYNRFARYDADISLLQLLTSINLNNNARPGSISGTNYNLNDNQVVWAAGWGVTSEGSSFGSEQIRHVQIWSVNQATCRQRYATLGATITDNMLCSGWLDVGGRDQCQGDSGGPLMHNTVVVGVCSWGQGCGRVYFPGVNTRVSRFANWVIANA